MTLFQPFTDRLSRDIRNKLSSSLAECLRRQDIEPAQQVTAGYLHNSLAPCYSSYIEERLDRYQQAVTMIAADRDPLWQGLILWNLGLFFEVHEILEEAWHGAAGAEKLLLQAMIRSAGMYIKFASGYFEAGRKMAARALPVVVEHRALLACYCQPEPLITALRAGSPQPPVLHLLR